MNQRLQFSFVVFTSRLLCNQKYIYANTDKQNYSSTEL